MLIKHILYLEIPHRHIVVSSVVSLLVMLVALSVTVVKADKLSSQRIITLSPHLAELVYVLDSGKYLSGVIEHSDYPQAVKNIPRIGSAAGLDLERILSIRPDLILAWKGGTRETDIRKLESLGLRVVSLKSESLEDIPASITTLGKLLGRQERAAELVLKFEKQRVKIQEKYKDTPGRRFFIEISSQPLMVLSNRHSFGAGLGLCNLKNIFADEKQAAIIVDLESILSKDVELILLRNSVADDAQEFTVRKSFYQPNDDSKAAFISFNEDAAFRQTPRLLDAVEQVCRNAYGF